MIPDLRAALVLLGIPAAFALADGTEQLEIRALRPVAELSRPQPRRVVDPEGLLERLDSRLERLATYAADFTQVNRYAAAALADTFSGRVYARMPDDFILSYSDPPGQFIRSDGTSLSMYIPENGQLVQGAIYRESDEMNFFKLLRSYLGKSDAEVSPSERDPEGRRVVLRPRDGATVKELRLDLDASELLPRRIDIVDDNDNVSTYLLRAPRVDDPISDDLFSPPLPADVEIIRQ